jgi:hypothetical protein
VRIENGVCSLFLGVSLSLMEFFLSSFTVYNCLIHMLSLDLWDMDTDMEFAL